MAGVTDGRNGSTRPKATCQYRLMDVQEAMRILIQWKNTSNMFIMQKNDYQAHAMIFQQLLRWHPPLVFYFVIHTGLGLGYVYGLREGCWLWFRTVWVQGWRWKPLSGQLSPKHVSHIPCIMQTTKQRDKQTNDQETNERTDRPATMGPEGRQRNTTCLAKWKYFPCYQTSEKHRQARNRNRDGRIACCRGWCDASWMETVAISGQCALEIVGLTRGMPIQKEFCQ